MRSTSFFYIIFYLFHCCYYFIHTHTHISSYTFVIEVDNINDRVLYKRSVKIKKYLFFVVIILTTSIIIVIVSDRNPFLYMMMMILKAPKKKTFFYNNIMFAYVIYGYCVTDTNSKRIKFFIIKIFVHFFV